MYKTLFISPLILAAGWGVAAAGLDLYGQQQTPSGTWDAIIVLGCRVMPSGAPSPTLKRRTRKAVELWRQDLAPIIVFTGGLGDSPPAEAKAAADYAHSLGVPRRAMVLEDESTSTEENARFAARRTDAARVIAVTDTYHVLRSRRVFQRYFSDVGAAGSRGQTWPRIKGALREVAAVTWYGITGRL